MPPTDLDTRIRAVIQAFADDLTYLAKRAAIAAIREALDAARPTPSEPSRRTRAVTLTPEPAPYELTLVSSTAATHTAADIPLRLDAYERHALVRALDENDGNVQAAADALGLKKSTMYRHLVTHGIPRPQQRLPLRGELGDYLKLDGPVSLEAYERAALERALRDAGGNLSDAAKLLGVGRNTMYRKCRAAGMR